MNGLNARCHHHEHWAIQWFEFHDYAQRPISFFENLPEYILKEFWFQDVLLFQLKLVQSVKESSWESSRLFSFIEVVSSRPAIRFPVCHSSWFSWLESCLPTSSISGMCRRATPLESQSAGVLFCSLSLLSDSVFELSLEGPFSRGFKQLSVKLFQLNPLGCNCGGWSIGRFGYASALVK